MSNLLLLRIMSIILTFCLSLTSSLNLLSLNAHSISINLSRNCLGSFLPNNLITSGVLNACDIAALVA